MVYRYSRKGLIMEGIVVLVFFGTALFNVPTPFRVLAVVLGLLTLKDILRNLKTEYQLTDRGLRKTFLGRSDYCMTWNQLSQITVNKYHHRWIILMGEKKALFTLRPSYIENYEDMARDIVEHVRKHRLKGVALHPEIPKLLGITVKCNAKGIIQ